MTVINFVKERTVRMAGVLALAIWCAASTSPAAKLRVSANKRYLLKDGRPFLYLCNSGWDLFMRLDRQEADEYLKNRADKGFNVIMSILIRSIPRMPGHLEGTSVAATGTTTSFELSAAIETPQGTRTSCGRWLPDSTRGTAHWFNSRDGSARTVGQFLCSGKQEIFPPTSGADNDWVLVLDDAAQDFPAPGTIQRKQVK